jgi:hypothetical protein
MRIIQTFWSQNENQINYSNRGGWLENKAYLRCWSLSCLNAKQLYGNIELYTDQLGYDLLIRQLKLPYDKVYITFDEGVMKEIPVKLWSLSKIYTYSLQTEPFVHIDGDFIFWEKIIFNHDILFQNIEVGLPFYFEVYEKLKQNINNFKESIFLNCIKDDYIKKASNLGIIGGYNIDIFHEYAQNIFSFIIKNINSINNIFPDKKNLNCFIEQYYFMYLAKKNGIVYGTIHPEIYENKNKDIFYDRADSIYPFSHYLGFAKKNEIVNDFVARKLYILYPYYFHKIEKSLGGKDSCEFYFFHKKNKINIDDFKEKLQNKLQSIDLSITHDLIRDFDRFWQTKLQFLENKSNQINDPNFTPIEKTLLMTTDDSNLYVRTTENFLLIDKFKMEWDIILLSESYIINTEVIQKTRIISAENIDGKPKYYIFFYTPFEKIICSLLISDIHAFIFTNIIDREFKCLSEIIKETINLCSLKREDSYKRLRESMVNFLYSTNNYGITEIRYEPI